MDELTAIIVVNGERIPAKEFLKNIPAATNVDANQNVVDGDELKYRLALPNESETEAEVEKRKNSYWDLIRAHWRDNSLRFAWQRVTDVFDEKDPDFKITEQDVEGYEEFPVLMKSKNRAEFDAMRKIADDIKLQRRIMSEHGMAANITASLVAGLADPISWATGIGGAKIVNSGFKILGVAKKMSAAKTAVTKAVTTGATAATIDTTVRHAFVDDVASMKEYAIGATASGIIGGFASAAPNIWRSMTGKHREECIKCCSEIAKDLQTPVPTESGYYQVEGALGLSSVTLGSPDVILANSPFQTGKDFGAKAFTYSFNIVNEKGERTAKGAAVEMLINNAKAIANNEAKKNTNVIFREWLKESGYGWVEQKFIGWKSDAISHGKAFIDFSNECRHARCYPDEPCKASVRKMLDFEKKFNDKLLKKAWDAGVFNENIEAFKTTLQKELKDIEGRFNDRKKLSNEEVQRIEYIKGRLERNDFTIKDISNIKDKVWFHRIYDYSALGSYKGNGRDKLISSLMRAYREEGSTLTDEELRLSAIRTSEKILGEIESMHHNSRKQRGLELKRAVDIPSHYIEEYLVGDPLMLMYSTVDTLCPDIELMKAFGTINKNDILKKLNFEKEQMQLRAKTNKEFNSINESYQKTYDTISLGWDRLRGESRADAQMGARFLKAFRNFNVATKLGKLPITTLYNLSIIQQHHGLARFLTTAFKTATPKGTFRNATNANAWLRMFEATGQSRLLELSKSLSTSFDDVLARAAVHLTFAQKFDDHMKAGVGYCVLEKIIHACRTTASGGKIKKKLSDELRRLGISKEYEAKIAKEFELHGSIGEKGVVAAGVENWSEDVADVFVSAIRQAQYEITLAPTAGATPALFDNAWMATLLQFKRCLATAYSKTTLPLLQDANRGKFIKVGSIIATSAAIAYLKELAMDCVTPRKRTLEDRLFRALSSMDVLTWGGYMLDVANSLRQQGKGLNTFETERAMGDIFGVGYGTAKDAINSFKAIHGVGTGEKMSRVQANAIRRMIPLNNMIWWSWMIDSMIDEKFPLKQKKPKEFKEGIITFPDTF